MKQNIPIAQGQRSPIIDVLRGWALFSVAVMNCSTIYSWNNHSNESHLNPFTDALKSSFEIIFESKGWTLLAILFGYGFSVLLQKPFQHYENQNSFFIRRMLFLFAFGFVNTLLFGGDILNDYALMGLILLFFSNLNSKSLFRVAIAILVLTPALQAILGRFHLLFTPRYRDVFYMLYANDTLWDNIRANVFMRYTWMLRLSYSLVLHLIQLGCFLLGMALQKSNFFEKINQNPRVLIKIAVVSAITSLLTYQMQPITEALHWTIEDYYNLYYPQVLSMMILSTAIVCLLYHSKCFKNVFELMKKTGRMTLTNYIVQNLIWFVLFINLRPNWSWNGYVLTGLLIYLLQMFFSKWWLKKYHFGILEWIWRSLAYRKWLPIVKDQLSNR